MNCSIPRGRGETVRRMPRHLGRLALLCTFAASWSGLAGCTAADNLSYGDMMVELDNIVAVEGEGDARTIHYADEAETSYWYMRQFWLGPLRWPMGWIFGVRGNGKLEKPGLHVRQLLAELPDESGSGLEANVQLAIRCGWMASFDETAGCRVAALDTLATVATRLELAVLPCSPEELLVPVAPSTFEAARAMLAKHTPERRTAPLGAADRREVAEALAAATSAPLPMRDQRWLLVQELARLQAAEPDEELQPAIVAALRTALVRAVRGVLVDLCRDRDPKRSEIRLCALEHFRRFGGPESVPLLVALTAATPEQIREGQPRFDPDPMIRLRLILYCGQLRGELARREISLPGIEGWAAVSPLDLLAQTAVTEQTYYSKLRVPALAGLSLALERPRIDDDIAWVRAWLDNGKRFPDQPATDTEAGK
ncbi:MAG: hypothetical protein RL398_1632 [Planctomycetota bacterium]